MPVTVITDWGTSATNYSPPPSSEIGMPVTVIFDGTSANAGQYGLAAPTSSKIGLPVTVIFDGTSANADNYGLSAPPSSKVGLPVTVIFDGTNYGQTPVATITTAKAGMNVQYIPTPGAADDQ